MSIDISVVVPSYLGPYEGAAKNRPEKLHRACYSVLGSTGTATIELVLVSDGCDETDAYWRKLAKHYGSDKSECRVNDRVSARHVRIEKAPFYDGAPRNAGVDAATGRIIGYCDYDDYVLEDHFDFVVQNFGENDWAYFDELVWPSIQNPSKLHLGGISTACMAHLKGCLDPNGPVRWGGGYASDWDVISKLRQHYPKHAHIGQGGHVRCHVPGKLDV
ncbi:MAG: glycosyltransferase family 2 protein [Betaproteobacteria bacterium]|nr:glycosyltransferase family 2 protein [Betaproteobacteria bacterium]NCA17337.1 glycosyltransferase family 2 protein [Betaproteobacteria bacterium]